MPTLLRAGDLPLGQIGAFAWDETRGSDLLTFSNDARTVTWSPGEAKREGLHPPAWIPVSTRLRLHTGRFRWDFVVEQMANRQIGVGFMLDWDVGPDWGFFGYLGASNSAWSYDPSTGDIVCATQSICGGLPKFDGQSGVVTIDLEVPRDDEGRGMFIVDGAATPPVALPPGAVVLPAACLLAETQCITLDHFEQ